MLNRPMLNRPSIIIWIIVWWLIAVITAMSSAQLPGDYNNDGKVNMKDWPLGDRCLIINNWLSHVPIYDPNDNITITANGVTDDSGYVEAVTFYHDENTLATDPNGADGWSVLVPAYNLPNGLCYLYAVAKDGSGNLSEPVGTQVIVKQ